MGTLRNKMLCFACLPEVGSIEEAAAAIARQGFREVSFWLPTVEQAKKEFGSLSSARELLESLGLRVSIVEMMMAWTSGDIDAAEKEAASIANTAVEIGAELVFTGCFDNSLPDHSVAVPALRRQCDVLADHGLRACIEFLPWSSIPNLAAARELCEASGADNIGIALDTWHFARSGANYDELEQLPPELIYCVQMSDAGTEPGDDMLEETMNHRLVSGEGTLDWPRLLDYIRRCPNAIIGPEVFNAELRELPTGQLLQQLYRAGPAMFG